MKGNPAPTDKRPAQARVTKGPKLRLDATCVQTNIHHPTDGGLLVDSVRVPARETSGGALVEFGRRVILDEVEGGIVTRYQILEPLTEHGQAVEAVHIHPASESKAAAECVGSK